MNLPLLANVFLLPALLGLPQTGMREVLDGFIAESSRHPEGYFERAERTWILLDPSAGSNPSGKDPKIVQLRAYYLHRLVLEYGKISLGHPRADSGIERRLEGVRDALMKRYRRAEAELMHNPDTSTVYGPGRFRFLAQVALIGGDTAAALADYRAGWDHFGLEDDFLSLLRLQAAPPDALLEEGLGAYPASSAAQAAICQAYMNGDSTRFAKALMIAERGQALLWPLSVDWKIRYARLLLARGRVGEAEAVLARGLDILDGDPRLGGNAPEAARLRREIFSLVEPPSR